MAKRSNGEGNVRKLRSGNWCCSIMDGYKDDGKRNVVTFTGSTKSEVLQMVREFKSDRENGTQVDKKTTFADWAEMWYKDYESEVQPSTYAGYRYTLNILLAFFGKMVISDILPYNINQFLNRLMTQGVSMSMYRKCRAMLIQIFDSAESNGMINRNPARLSKKNRSKAIKDDIAVSKKDAFSDEEKARLMENLSDDMIGNSIRSLLGSGIRVQELLALTEEDIAADGSMIHINKAVKTVNGRSIIGLPKSKTSIRDVPIPEDYRPFVRYMREHAGSNSHIWVKEGKSPYYLVSTYRKQYYAAIKSVAGVRRLPPHCCRHTYVTSLQAMGIPMETIAKLVGHSNIVVTDNYLHVNMKSLANAVTVLNSASGTTAAS